MSGMWRRLGLTVVWLAIAMDGTETTSMHGTSCTRSLQRPARRAFIALRGGGAQVGGKEVGEDSSSSIDLPSDLTSSEPDAGSAFQGGNDQETIAGLRERLKNAEEKLEEADVRVDPKPPDAPRSF